MCILYRKIYILYVQLSRAVKLEGYIGSTCRTNGEVKYVLNILWTFRKWDGVVGIGWSWLRIGTGGGHL
jgi:hypothetical protein